jgi:hypothetical protein
VDDYLVKIKDHKQNITHSLHFWAESQNHANNIALDYMRHTFHHGEFEIAPKKRKIIKLNKGIKVDQLPVNE